MFPNNNIEENPRRLAQSMAPLILKRIEIGPCAEFLQ